MTCSVSALDAAAKVLGEKGEPMNQRDRGRFLDPDFFLQSWVPNYAQKISRFLL